MIQVDEALKIILDSIEQSDYEEIQILEASERILYENIIAGINIPPFNNSAMDGFAVIANDIEYASLDNPVKLKIIDEIKAGELEKELNVTSNHAIRIMTGAPMPGGADSVIQVEDTREDSNTVNIFKSLKKHENVRFAGEDISKGQTVLEMGDIIKSPDLGLLASLNYNNVKVFKRPEVAVISTGDEIVDIGDKIKHGQIRNSNAYILLSEIKKYNAIPKYIGIAKDNLNDTRDKFLEAMKSDIIITTGGVSMGKYDFVKEVMNDLGIEIKIEKIKMKPGKPVVFGCKDDKLFFGLPGNPVSTAIAFIQFVRPAILKFMGAKKIDKPVIKAILDNEIRKKPDRTHFIRGYFKVNGGQLHVSSTGPQGSGILRSMSEANCLIILPEGVKLAPEGKEVSIQLIQHEEI